MKSPQYWFGQSLAMNRYVLLCMGIGVQGGMGIQEAWGVPPAVDAHSGRKFLFRQSRGRQKQECYAEPFLFSFKAILQAHENHLCLTYFQRLMPNEVIG